MSEPNTVTKTAPEHIWLQHSDSDLDVDSPFPESYDGISWCAEQVFQADVEYTRSDLHATLKRQRDALLEALKELVACRDLNALLEYDYLDLNEREDAEAEYTRRKPAAWTAARAAIAAVEGEKNG